MHCTSMPRTSSPQRRSSAVTRAQACCVLRPASLLLWCCSIPLRDVYEAKLEEYAQKMAEVHVDVHTGAGKKMTRKERLALLSEATARDDMQVEGLPEIASKVVEPGVQQLAVLTESGEWNMVVVDVKMTTKQTPQGKKSRFSAMVMVGNLSVRAASLRRLCVRLVSCSTLLAAAPHASLAEVPGS